METDVINPPTQDNPVTTITPISPIGATRVVATTHTNGSSTPENTVTTTRVELPSNTLDTHYTAGIIYVSLICFGLSYLGVVFSLVFRLIYLTVNPPNDTGLMLTSTLDNLTHVGIASALVLGIVILGQQTVTKLIGLFVK